MDRKWLYMAASLLFGIMVHSMELGLGPGAHAVLSVLCVAAMLWLTEAVPLHVTALLIPFLLVLLTAGLPQPISVPAAFSPFFDPVVVLLMGGFVLARALQKHHLDEEIAYYFVSKIGSSPRRFLFAMMAVAALLSMWMSNTATAAVLMPIALVVLRRNGLKPLKSEYGKSVVLGVAFAASIGGLATIVGTTPNAIAVKFLADEGIRVTFAGWMAHALPISLFMIPAAWLILSMLHKPEIKKLKVRPHSIHLLRQQKQVLAVFAITAALWLSTELHGISSAMVALIPVFLLSALSLFDTEDFGKIHWNILVLIGGGLSLGMAMHATGLDSAIALLMQSHLAGSPAPIILLTVALACIAMSSFSSNTGTAAFMIPIMVPLALSLGIGVQPLVILAGLAVSLTFIVPIGTPPNAIAYSSGYASVKDMAKAGALVALTGALALSIFAWLLW